MRGRSRARQAARRKAGQGTGASRADPEGQRAREQRPWPHRNSTARPGRGRGTRRRPAGPGGAGPGRKPRRRRTGRRVRPATASSKPADEDVCPGSAACDGGDTCGGGPRRPGACCLVDATWAVAGPDPLRDVLDHLGPRPDTALAELNCTLKPSGKALAQTPHQAAAGFYRPGEEPADAETIPQLGTRLGSRGGGNTGRRSSSPPKGRRLSSPPNERKESGDGVAGIF